MSAVAPSFTRVHNSLMAALQDPGTLDVDYTLSPTVLNMFKKQSVEINYRNATARFKIAKNIFRSIMTSPNTAGPAVFYALMDEEQCEEDYREALINMSAYVAGRVGSPPPSLSALGNLFAQERDRLINLSTNSPHISTQERIQLRREADLYDRYIKSNKISDLRTALVNGTTVDDWFDDPSQKVEVLNLAKRVFYGVNDVGAASNNGRIYTPGGPIPHTWGVNCAWLLGLIHKRVDIRCLSVIDFVRQYRARPTSSLLPNAPYEAHPSAFALEICTALSAGYTLNYDSTTEAINFTAPTYPALTEDNMDGIEGHGLLQTRDDQIAIYNEIMHKINLGHNITNWIPPTILNRASTARLAAIVGAGPDNDVGVVGSPNIAVNELRIIAGRTTNPIILATITRHRNADASVFAAIRNHPLYPASSATIAQAIVENNNADPISLVNIVQHNVATPAGLQLIASHRNADASVFAAIRNHPLYPANSATIAQAIVGNNNADPISLVSIVQHNAATSADLQAIVRHRNTDASVLTAVARHSRADTSVFSAIRNHPLYRENISIIAQAIIENNNAEPAFLASISQYVTTPADLQLIASHRNANASVFAAICDHPSYHANMATIAPAIIGNNNADPVSLADIARFMSTPASLEAIARHRNADVSVLTAVARHPRADANVFATVYNHPLYRANIATIAPAIMGNNNADPAFLASIAQFANLTGLQTIASHRNANASVFAAICNHRLYHENIATIAPAIIGNNNADPASLVDIAQFATAPASLEAIARHRNADVSVLTAVARHPRADASVFAAVRNRPLYRANIATIASAIIGNNNADPVSLASIAQIATSTGLQTIASHRNADARVLAVVANNRNADASVLTTVARHPRADEGVSEVIARRMNPNFDQTAFNNSNDRTRPGPR